MAERALELMVERARSPEAFGRPLAGHGVVAAQIAEARMAIEQARLLVLKTAWLIDTVGVQAAASEVAAIKVVVPRMACQVIDDAIQVHGGAGVSDDVPLAAMYAGARTLRIADGPDEVHVRSVARAELARALVTAELHPTGRPTVPTVAAGARLPDGPRCGSPTGCGSPIAEVLGGSRDLASSRRA